MIRITSRISINESELTFEFVRSSGPGGQNVNKVATAVQMRFNAVNSPAIPGEVFDRLRTLVGSRMTKDGVVIITASRFRTQERNRQDAIERLVKLIERAAVRPRPRRKTRPTVASKVRRLDDKRRRGETKRRRDPVPDSDD